MNHDLIKRLAIQTDSRIFHLVIDGLGGLSDLESGKTELEAANTPNLDLLALEGAQGLSMPVAPGITPGSGPAHLSLFGYDPVATEVGRGILDISGIGFEFERGDLAARINFCTIDSDGVITDRRAGRINDDEGRRVSAILAEGLALDGIDVHFLHTKEYRAGVVLRPKSGEALAGDIADTDPQSVGKKPLAAQARNDASKPAAALIDDIVAQARELLKDEAKANMILVRGIDSYEPLPSFGDLFKLRPLCIAAYPMYRGVARLVGMKVADIGSTASLADQFDMLESVWKDGTGEHDYVFFHVKKTDSAGEDGNYAKKVHVLEELDELLPRLLALKPDVIVVTGDHSTPSQMKGHSWHPLPTLIRATNVRRDGTESFGESKAARGNLGHFHATEIMPLALANAGKLLKFGA